MEGVAVKWLDRDTVRAPHTTLCLSEEEFRRVAKSCKVSDPGVWMEEKSHSAVLHTWGRDGNLICVVCLHPDALAADPIEVACTLVHESVHIFQRLCDSIGETSPSKEFEAYSIESISKGLMREFKRRACQ